MTFNDYIEETKENAKDYIRDNFDYISDIDSLRDDLFLDDTVTGNASGSYTCNTWKAQENVKNLIWDDDFIDNLKMYYGEDIGDLIKRGAETVDVTARCLALDFIDIEEIYNEIKEEKEG